MGFHSNRDGPRFREDAEVYRRRSEYRSGRIVKHCRSRRRYFRGRSLDHTYSPQRSPKTSHRSIAVRGRRSLSPRNNVKDPSKPTLSLQTQKSTVVLATTNESPSKAEKIVSSNVVELPDKTKLETRSTTVSINKACTTLGTPNPNPVEGRVSTKTVVFARKSKNLLKLKLFIAHKKRWPLKQYAQKVILFCKAEFETRLAKTLTSFMAGRRRVFSKKQLCSLASRLISPKKLQFSSFSTSDNTWKTLNNEWLANFCRSYPVVSRFVDGLNGNWLWQKQYLTVEELEECFALYKLSENLELEKDACVLNTTV